MSKIRIKNFGPIKEGFKENDGWMDIKKVTLYIGNQGSGKSTVAKVITTMTWLEKSINRGDVSEKDIHGAQFREFFEYMLTHNYFTEQTEIEYVGEVMHCLFNSDKPFPVISMKRDLNYKVPKIMYIPAERNFLSIVQNAFLLKDLPESLITFAQELRKSHLALNGHLMDLPLEDMQFKYDKKNERAILVGKDYELEMKEASSGYHSMVPLYLVSKYLADEIEKGPSILRDQLSAEQSIRRNKEVSEVSFDNSLSPQEKEARFKEIDAKYLNTCFINIVEEPEQNLFPSSQQRLLNSLLEFTNRQEGNKLIMTTHSPYLINFLTLAVEAHDLKLKADSPGLREKLESIVPLDATIAPGELIVYELDETNGTIQILDTYKGLPSDDNMLNYELAEGNELFAKLLEIEQKL